MGLIEDTEKRYLSKNDVKTLIGWAGLGATSSIINKLNKALEDDEKEEENEEN